MKNYLIFALLGLTVVGSWAFLPPAAAAGGYLMLIGSGRATLHPELTIIQPDGTH